MAMVESKRSFTNLEDLEWNLNSYIPGLESVAKRPAVENPFKSNLHMTILDKIKTVLLCILVPFRMLLLGITLCCASVIGTVFLIGHKDTDPPTPFRGIRRFGQELIYACSRIALFACGYHYVRIKGTLHPDTRVIVAAPHSSFMDTLVIALIRPQNAVTKTENLQHSFLGNCIRLLQPTAVSRAEKHSKKLGVKEIKRRVLSKEWNPTMLFPEGTCTNRSAYVSFKPGAFYPGVPVQPVIIRYKDRIDYATWTWMGSGQLPLMCLMMAQLYSTAELEILPPYTPSQEEIDDPFLYARNVRNYIAKVDNLPVTDHSFEDCRLMLAAGNLNLPMEAGLVEYYKLNRSIGINCDHMIEQLKKFSKINLKRDGYIDVDEFCDYLNLPATDEVLTLFRIYDLHKYNGIGFREFLIGEFMIAKHFCSEENIRTIFDLLRPRRDRHLHYVTFEDFLSFMRTKIEIYEECVQEIYNEMDIKGSGRTYYEDFKDFCLDKPGFVLLFLHFRNKEDIPRLDMECEDEVEC